MALRVNGKRRSCGPGYPQRRGWNDPPNAIRPLPISAPPFANLTAMSLLALVGRYVLIHNAISFSVAQRRALSALAAALVSVAGKLVHRHSRRGAATRPGRDAAGRFARLYGSVPPAFW